MEDVKRILVVSWMDRDSPKAVHYGITLARTLGAELFVMHAIYNPFGLEGWSIPVPNLKQEYDKLIADTGRQLDIMMEEEKKNGTRITKIVVKGEPVKEILKTVKEKNVNLLVLPTHSETRLEHMFFGHTTEEIVRKLPCSILMVRKEPAR
ncbi:MAG: universal stress protein [Nitrospiraceae bacterium]|nr:universal stress protein [Nitrospiraceae bacterium]